MSDRSNLLTPIAFPGKLRGMDRADFDRVILIEGQTEFEPTLSIDGLKDRQLAKGCSLLVIDDPKSYRSVVGYAIFFRDVRRGGVSHYQIERLGVRASHQRRQFGLQLVQAVYGRLKAKGDRMTYQIREDDGPRINFLNRIGFGRVTPVPSHSSLPDSLYFSHEFPGEIPQSPPGKTCPDLGSE